MSRTGSRIRNFNFPKPVVCWACPQSKAARCKDGVRIAVRRLNIPLPHFYKLAVVFASARLRWPTEIIPPDSEALADRSSGCSSEIQPTTHIATPVKKRKTLPQRRVPFTLATLNPQG